jgi:eukaryotic-like serine/threonine-protein kinase
VSRLTQVGNIIGKVAYMPPERIEGAEATVSGDLFALGCVLHELLFGALPEFSEGGLRLPRTERPDAPAAYQMLRGVLEVALHPLPRRRYPDARAFQRGLDPARNALPAVDLTSWLRESFEQRWTRERELSELSDPSSAEVEALLSRESTVAPGAESETTQLVEEQETRLLQRPR